MQKVWMLVSDDKYELPLAIADTAKELAERCNVSIHTVISNFTRYQRGEYKKSKYLCVKVEDEDAEIH